MPKLMKKILVALISLVSLAPSVFLVTQASATRDPGLPNPVLTPGAVNQLVNQSNIYSTICVSGYTKTIRPSSYYTNKIKFTQLRSGYTLRGDTNPSNYEEDHLVPLEVGGDPTSVKNLFPQPWLTTWSAGKKDRLENKIHSLVCSGAITLATGQKVFMTNWILGYQKYVGK